MEINGKTVVFAQGMTEVIAALSPARVLYLDTETTGFDPYTNELLLVQLTSKEAPLFVIDFRKLGSEEVEQLRGLLYGKELVAHNAKFDLKFLKVHVGLDIASDEVRVFDTQLAELVLSAGVAVAPMRYTSLGQTLLRRYEVALDKSVRSSFVGYGSEDFSENLIEYAAKDITYLPDLRSDQIAEAERQELIPVFKLEFALVKHVAAMELNGVRIDRDAWKEQIKVHERLRKESLENVYSMAEKYSEQSSLFGGAVLNLNSPVALLSFLRDRVGINIDDTRKQTLKRVAHPMVSAILDYREHEKLVSSFGETTLAKINPVTHRLHPEFNQCATATGRFSSSNPNVQQIPSKGDGARLRECFVPEPGNSIVCADYSQIELRILAELSEEPELIDAYKSGIDIHLKTAAVAFGKSPEEITSSQRKVAKVLNFAVAYGGGPMAVSKGLIQVISEEEAQDILLKEFGAYPDENGAYYCLAKEFVNSYFQNMPKAKEYLESSGKNAVYTRYSKTRLGRKRFYPELDKDYEDRDEFKAVRSSVERRGKNQPIQGLSADITKLAIVNLSREFHSHPEWGAKILLQVHDEIVSEAKTAFAPEVGEVQKRVMLSAAEHFLKLVPVDLSLTVDDHWSKD